MVKVLCHAITDFICSIIVNKDVNVTCNYMQSIFWSLIVAHTARGWASLYATETCTITEQITSITKAGWERVSS